MWPITGLPGEFDLVALAAVPLEDYEEPDDDVVTQHMTDEQLDMAAAQLRAQAEAHAAYANVLEAWKKEKFGS